MIISNNNNNNNDTETNYRSMIVENTTALSGTHDQNSLLLSTLPVVHTFTTSNTIHINEQQEQRKNSFQNNTGSREIILFGILLLVTLLYEKTGFISLTERPIPYQILLDTNDNNNEQQYYYIRDLTNNQPILSETISSNFGLQIGFILPYLIQFSLSLWKRWNNSNKNNNNTNTDDTDNDDVYGTICIYNVSYTLVTIVTEFCKNYVGYLRPLFYELCIPSNDTSYENSCTNTNSKDVSNSHKSFPSGHASTAFCGLTLLSLYIHTRFGIGSIPQSYTVINTTGSTDSNEIKIVHRTKTNNNSVFQYRCYSLLSLVPIAVALFIAVSRIHDNRHFPADAIAGSIIGTSISIFVHSLWML